MYAVMSVFDIETIVYCRDVLADHPSISMIVACEMESVSFPMKCSSPSYVVNTHHGRNDMTFHFHHWVYGAKFQAVVECSLLTS